MKPAVLGVTLQKNELSSFVPKSIFLKVQLYSKRKKRAIPQSSKTAVEQKTSFECTESVLILNFLSLRSCQTIKPIPPKTIRAEIVKIITGSLLTVVSEDDGENIPIKSKPALQKAETLVNTAIYTPRLNPARGIKRTDKSAAPASSHTTVNTITVLTRTRTLER